jgi:uncharacterized protein (TIGR03067 family)
MSQAEPDWLKYRGWICSAAVERRHGHERRRRRPGRHDGFARQAVVAASRQLIPGAAGLAVGNFSTDGLVGKIGIGPREDTGGYMLMCITGSLSLMVVYVLGLQATEYDRQAYLVTEALKLQGEWEVTAEESAGKALKHPPKGERESVTVLTVNGTNFDMTIRAIKVDGLPLPIERGRFKLTPPLRGAIDLLNATRGKQERLGIYDCDGGILKLCLAPPGVKERPENFATKGTKNTLFVFAKKRTE